MNRYYRNYEQRADTDLGYVLAKVIVITFSGQRYIRSVNGNTYWVWSHEGEILFFDELTEDEQTAMVFLELS